MFSFVKNAFSRIYTSLTASLSRLFSRETIDESFYEELEKLLITSDVGFRLTKNIIAHLKSSAVPKTGTPDDVALIREALQAYLISLLLRTGKTNTEPRAVMLVGVNGSGKTTFISKYAAQLIKKKKRVLVIAADTFRAAAVEQLTVWTSRVGADLFIGSENQDPAAVIFDGCKKFVTDGYDHVIIDTAGRLQTRVNLLKELEKMNRSITRYIPASELAIWLTIDTMLGQNGLAQAEEFATTIPLTALVLTKCDGTGKGGIVFAISEKLSLPISYMTLGEEIENLAPFDAPSFVTSLLSEKTSG